MPLFKIQLQNEKKHLSWKTTAYIHGDSVPQGLNLSKGIVDNWLWASQTVNLYWQELYNTTFSAKVRLLSPVGTDSVSARFKTTLTSGKLQRHLRRSKRQLQHHRMETRHRVFVGTPHAKRKRQIYPRRRQHQASENRTSGQLPAIQERLRQAPGRLPLRESGQGHFSPERVQA